MSSRNNYRRYNPLLDEWVIVAANRVHRPWQGTKSDAKGASGFSAVTGINALAPGGERANGKVTPEYDSVYVFENDFPSFTHFPPSVNKKSKDTDEDELFKQEEIRGECRVICYHPNSEKSIALMDETEVLAVVQLWCDLFDELSRKWKYVQSEKRSLAAILCQLMIKYDNIFECSFAFGMGWIGAPTPSGYQGSPELAEDHYKYWQLHLLVHPPLLRSSSISKHMAGYEILAEPQRDITPEMAAGTIRSQSALHYTVARNAIQKS